MIFVKQEDKLDTFFPGGEKRGAPKVMPSMYFPRN